MKHLQNYLRESLGIEGKQKPLSRDAVFWLLTAVQAIMLVICNIGVAIFIPIAGGRELSVLGLTFQLAVTGGIFFFPLTCIADDIQTELFGRKNNLAMLVSFVFLWIVAGIFYIMSLFTRDPSSAMIPDLWTAGLASTVAYVFSSTINSEVLIALKRKWPKSVMLRFLGSTAVAQFFDTLVFTAVAVWTGLFPDWRMGWALFPIEWVAKLGYEALLTHPIKKIVKYIESVTDSD